MGTTRLLRIGEVAQRAGLSRDTVRHYERLGLLVRAARTPSGYREYPESVVRRIGLVQNALRFGFSLKEIAGFLRVRESGGAPCREVRAAAEQKLATVERQIQDLSILRNAMRDTLRDWDLRLGRTPAGTAARLLDALPSQSATTIRPPRVRPL